MLRSTERPANVTSMSSWNRQCQFFVALQNNEVNNVENILSQGVDPDTKFQIGNQKRPAIFLCVERGKEELVKALVKWGCSINQSDTSGLTALHIAASHGNDKIVQLLLDNRAHVNAVTLKGQTPLHMASQRSSLEVVCKLVKAGACLDRPDDEQKTPLLIACIHGHANVARYLIDQGSQVDVTSSCGITPLLFVAISPHLDMNLISCLLDAGANVNRQNVHGESALHAVMRGASNSREKAIDILVAYKCDLNLRTSLGHTALHLAVLQRDNVSALRLIQAGCFVNLRDELGLPPLFYAVRDGNLQIVNLLLAAGAQLNGEEWLRNEQYCTSLDPELVEWLNWKRKQCHELRAICRSVIRAYLTVPVHASISKLMLPQSIKHYLTINRL